MGVLAIHDLAKKMQEITDNVESGANFIANNEDKAQGFIGDVSRKINA